MSSKATASLAPLIIVSGPAGSGKSTLIRRAIPLVSFPLRLAVSATTRQPRPGEIDGVDYHFWPAEQFKNAIAEMAFIEYAQVHGSNYYGTPRNEIDGYRERGTGVILDIDVQGAAQVRPLYPEHVSIFVCLPSMEVYEERLKQRGSETAESIARRMRTARLELARKGEYQHVIVNDDLQDTVARFLALIDPHRPGLA